MKIASKDEMQNPKQTLAGFSSIIPYPYQTTDQFSQIHVYTIKRET